MVALAFGQEQYAAMQRYTDEALMLKTAQHVDLLQTAPCAWKGSCDFAGADTEMGQLQHSHED